MITSTSTVRARRFREKNPELVKTRQRIKNKADQKARREYVRGLKKTPCLDCGGTFPPECMDFDHRPGEVKLGTVSGWTKSRPLLVLEIAKCDLVCANCHRVRTAKRKNWRRSSPIETTPTRQLPLQISR